jgi:hypothetical protein
MNVKENLPRGRVLQRERQLGMSSVSLLMWNEDQATSSCRPHIYTKSTSLQPKNSAHRVASQINMTLIHHIITLSHLWRTRTLQNTGFKTSLQMHLFYSDITVNCNLCPFNHLLWPSPCEISKYEIKACSIKKSKMEKMKAIRHMCAYQIWRMAWANRSHVNNTFDTLTQHLKGGTFFVAPRVADLSHRETGCRGSCHSQGSHNADFL